MRKIMDAKNVEILRKRLIFDDKFQIQEAEVSVQRYDGQMGKPVRRLVFERGDAAAAILFNRDSQKILLVEQFRYPTYEKGPGWIQEVVAGVIKPDEGPEEAIRREVEEEVGYRLQQLTPIATFYVSPGGTSERIFLYYAEVGNSDRVSAGGGLVEENEDIQLVEYSKSELRKALASGQFQDAKTLIAVQWLQLQRKM
jgi:nudix-type nucleoside diphosphatase (YffH/AdpP family)